MTNNKPSSTAKPVKKVKRPSALKRNLQNERQRLRNRSFRSSVQTAIRNLEQAAVQFPENVTAMLQNAYSVMDKGVKKGIFTSQKAARTKSRLSLYFSRKNTSSN